MSAQTVAAECFAYHVPLKADGSRQCTCTEEYLRWFAAQCPKVRCRKNIYCLCRKRKEVSA